MTSASAIIRKIPCRPQGAITPAAASDDLDRIIPGFSRWVDDVALVRHPWANAIYPPGRYQPVIDFRTRAETLEGVSFVGSPYGGIHMEGALLTAKRAVARVETGRWNAGATPWLPAVVSAEQGSVSESTC